MPPTRLLNTRTHILEDTEYSNLPYAILSHRWRRELTFKHLRGTRDVPLDNLPIDPGLEASRNKLITACDVARLAQIDYIWTDTICIDKDNSEELSRTLRSMFQYYGEATVCYAFLDDIQKRTGFERVALKGKSQIELLQGEGANQRRDSEWFAPRDMKFYDQDWQQLGAKSEFKPQVQRITRIESKYLESPDNLRHASVATKMSWMSGRTTALKEEIAYSLIGLFDVSTVPLYGEGVKAFFRLQDTLIRDNAFDETLFAWSSGVTLRCFGRPDPWVDSEWGLLAPSPDCFAQSGDIVQWDTQGRLGGGFQLTNQGVTVQLPLKETKTRMGSTRPR
ncbi:hypothetical protein LTR66_008529 [Elasticomyces elasticus]|nr:hypothetical protein LTR66_008529 [Elasticomyces elasticus]